MHHPTAATALRLTCGALALVTFITAPGCSHEKTVPPELSGVYGRVHESRQDYEAGLELVLAGDDVAAQNMLAAATKRLFVAARECAHTPGCDMNVFIDSMEQLVAEQRLAREQEQAVAAAEDLPEVPAAPDDDVPMIVANSLLTGADLADLIPLNRQVNAALNTWLTWNRPELMEAHQNYQFLRPWVAPIYEDAGLPEALLFAMMTKESGAKVHAYSRAGAAGPLQFMRRTALHYGLGMVDGFDTRLDPVQATRANVRYLKDLLRVFDGNLELALAAYNMGETRLRRMRRRHSGTDFWDPQIHYALPWETRNYVPAVLAAAWLYLHPAEYGLQLPEPEATATSILLEDDVSLGELAVCLGHESNPHGWFRTLRNLNPRLSPGDRARAGTSLQIPTMLVSTYAERCAGDSPLLVLARELHDAGYPEKPEVIHYTVRRGDTLAAIAARHRCSVRELAELNDIKAPNYVIHVGQRLTVPTRG